MSTINYLQYGLEPLFDSGLETGDSKEVEFVVTLGVVDGKISLTCVDKETGLNYITIEKDSVVRITLEGEQLYFSADYEAITTKSSLASYYGGLCYDLYVPEYGRYKSVTFQAKKNAGGKYGTMHAFNINVDLLLEDASGTVTWQSLTIDPDIANPPPYNED
ncbi:hypothetical protein MTR62_04250 [Novosphingobium sp. 1949]|uniref:Uncharacterized protein n=1 Tax=Novosphingobium organovorum TaxID=2930092 RepID=A0ABT0BA36_9SPHN|nr:nucleotide synthetase [Novosphingobium organovorum]MCJ2181916.1 hypothetical protein [Novosphingobium organovorum]